MVTIFDLIFKDILQISPTIISKYPALQDQILYLIFIPHVLLLLFVYALSIGIVGRIVKEHRGLRYLVGLAAYAFIILGGWYGSFLIPLFVNFFMIGVILALIVFFVSIIVHPARGPSIFKFFGLIGGYAGKRRTESKKEDTLRKRLEVIDDQLTDLQATADPNNQWVQFRMSQLKEEKKTIEKELEE